jgi:beta-glucosidase/6-phospho-beta-glucosidase/beta-galactosidase
MKSRPLFDGFFLGGFECSCHRLEDGRRLDLLSSTRHDVLADSDYALLRGAGITAAREGVSWVRCEPRRGMFSFSSVEARLIASHTHAVQVIWDLMHFGWPDSVDIFSPMFPLRFGRYARAFARWYADHAEGPPMVAPINEMSFLAWAGGDVRVMNPFVAARGVELKAQLVRATIEGIEAIRSVLPHARFLQPEPVIHIVPASEHPKTWRRVESDELLQYQAWDMLTGRVWPTLGGRPEYLDIVGVNFYSDNQFMLDGSTIHRGDPRYKPFAQMLREVFERYGKPMMVSETGAEGDARTEWLRYVCDEAAHALASGVPLHGITLYPVLNHEGWADGRDCHNGLWSQPDAQGRREAHAPLFDELREQDRRLVQARERVLLSPPDDERFMAAAAGA